MRDPADSTTEAVPNTRLEALSDGVFAIALTLLVLDIRLPDDVSVTSTAELWVALRHLGPALFAFVLSFAIILITWVNHHAFVKMVRGGSAPLVYANGFLLLTVATLPFPTTLLGDFLLTDYATPAVVLYDVVLAVQAIAWILLTAAALGGGLAADDEAAASLRVNRSHGYGAVVLYGLLAVAAFWLPLTVAAVTTVSWGFWLLKSIRSTAA